MKNICLINTRAILPNEIVSDCCVLIKDGTIQEIVEGVKDSDAVIDLEGATLLAGFIDIHNHGAVGFDVNESSKEDLIEIGKFLASDGVTGWLPTLVPDSDERYRKVVGAIDELMIVQKDLPIAQVLGVHYEGVFANEKMCGALRPEFFKNFNKDNKISQLPAPQNGVYFTTLAPEIENGIELVRKLVELGWIVSVGHTKADVKTLDAAFEAGARHLTHFYNAMTGLHHRDLGVVGWALTHEGVTFDVIADGIHVAPLMLKFACENKSPENVLLISDSVLPTGFGDGDYEIWGEKISVVDGKTQNEKGSIAGSVITILDAFRMMHDIGFSEIEVSKMASLNPAKLLGIEKARGSIEVGKRADLVAIDANGNVKITMVGGEVAK